MIHVNWFPLHANVKIWRKNKRHVKAFDTNQQTNMFPRLHLPVNSSYYMINVSVLLMQRTCTFALISFQSNKIEKAYNAYEYAPKQHLIGTICKCEYDAFVHIFKLVHGNEISGRLPLLRPQPKLSMLFSPDVSSVQLRVMQLCWAGKTDFIIIHLLQKSNFRWNKQTLDSVWYCSSCTAFSLRIKQDWYSCHATEEFLSFQKHQRSESDWIKYSLRLWLWIF